MNDINALIELAERVEREPASRELDAEIMFDLYAKPVGQAHDGGPSGYLWPEDNASWSFGQRFPGKDRKWFEDRRGSAEKETLLIERDGALVLMNSLRILPLTSSVDAAKSLERKLWAIDVDLMGAECVVQIRFGVGDDMEMVTADAFSDHAEARARVAASLRALAGQPPAPTTDSGQPETADGDKS